MPIIRLPEEHWGKIWRELVAIGPISRLQKEPIYAVGEVHIKLLRRKKLPFEIVEIVNGQKTNSENG